MSDDKPYEVGYGKPPKHTQFGKGQSGNRKGRPKGSRNFNTELNDVLDERMTITHKGKPEKVSARMAALLRLREKALSKGELPALDRFLSLALAQNDEQQSTSQNILGSRDQEIMERLWKGGRFDEGSANDEVEEGGSGEH